MRSARQVPPSLASQSMGTHPSPQTRRVSQISELTSEEQWRQELFSQFLAQTQYMKRLTEMAYDYKHPVDEYIVIPQNAFTLQSLPLIINPDYDETVRYTGFAFSLPLGCTGATLSIGTNRVIQIYSGAALTTQTIQQINGLCIEAAPSDKRQLAILGTTTSNGYFSMSGNCFEREGAR